MTFEEEFPSLKESRTDSNWFIYPEGDGDLIMIEGIKKHCLDKQRVKEAIKRCKHPDFAFNLRKFKAELGLEDEK